jgi:hypothetical protein
MCKTICCTGISMSINYKLALTLSSSTSPLPSPSFPARRLSVTTTHTNPARYSPPPAACTIRGRMGDHRYRSVSAPTAGAQSRRRKLPRIANVRSKMGVVGENRTGSGHSLHFREQLTQFREYLAPFREHSAWQVKGLFRIETGNLPFSGGNS